MKRTYLSMSVHIPITYDDTRMSENTAIDVAEKMASEVLTRAFDGRHFDTDGRYQDCAGPSLAPAPPLTEKPTTIESGAAPREEKRDE